MGKMSSLLLLTATLLSSTYVSAEHCWMIGCKGSIGYIYVPHSQIEITQEMKTIKVDNDSYTLDTSDRLFKEYGLPNVNALVTLNIYASLLKDDSAIRNPEILKKISQWSFIYDKKALKATIRDYAIDGGNSMKAGTRLRILGYTNIDSSSGGHSSLFALVLYESDD